MVSRIDDVAESVDEFIALRLGQPFMTFFLGNVTLNLISAMVPHDLPNRFSFITADWSVSSSLVIERSSIAS